MFKSVHTLKSAHTLNPNHSLKTLVIETFVVTHRFKKTSGRGELSGETSVSTFLWLLNVQSPFEVGTEQKLNLVLNFKLYVHALCLGYKIFLRVLNFFYIPPLARSDKTFLNPRSIPTNGIRAMVKVLACAYNLKYEFENHSLEFTRVMVLLELLF